jgi:hypothetical protein
VLEPALPRLLAEERRLQRIRDGETGIDLGLDRMLAQEVAAEAVDRADRRQLQVGERLAQRRPLAARPLGEGALDLFPDAQPQLGGGLLGERDRDDLGQARAAGADVPIQGVILHRHRQVRHHDRVLREHHAGADSPHRVTEHGGMGAHHAGYRSKSPAHRDRDLRLRVA